MSSTNKKEVSVSEFIFNLTKKHRKELNIILLIAFLGSSLTVAVPYLYGRIFDLAIIPNTTVSLLLSLIAIWALLSLISNFALSRTSALGSALGAKLSLGAEVDAYGHFLTLPMQFHKTKRTGEILHKISQGCWYLQQYVHILATLLPSIFFLVLASGVMLFIEWRLAAITIVTLIVYAFATIKLTKPLLETENKMYASFEKSYGKIYDKLYNVPLVKSFAKENQEKELFLKHLLKKVFPSIKESAEQSARLQHSQGIIYNLSFILVLGAAIFFLRNEIISQGEFIMFFGYLTLSFNQFFRLSEFYNYYKRASVAVKRLMKLKNLNPESINHGDKKIENFKGNIEFKNVVFGYEKGKEILNGINLQIRAGESVALVGESGMGKTTLSELISGYYSPSKGKIYFDGIETSKLDLKWLREQVANVPQEISIFNEKLIENLKYANSEATMEEVIKATKAANAHDFINSLPKKYNTFVGQRGVKLSVGQKQRLAISMAFLKNPKILILDEPTASLDAKSEKAVQNGIKNLIENRTTIIIAHRFSTVKDVDKIIVIDKGKIIESGKHADLMKKKGKYFELYSLQKGLD